MGEIYDGKKVVGRVELIPEDEIESKPEGPFAGMETSGPMTYPALLHESPLTAEKSGPVSSSSGSRRSGVMSLGGLSALNPRRKRLDLISLLLMGSHATRLGPQHGQLDIPRVR
jgi:hypothetical protein